MSQHVSDELMRRFSVGALDEDVAIAVADHIDGCPLCLTRAIAADPLADAFAAVDDPTCPPDLIEDILQVSRRPSAAPLPRAELLASAALLSLAGMLLLGLGEPLSLLTELAVASGAAFTGLAHFIAQVEASSPSLLISLGAGTLLLAVMTSSQLWATPQVRRAA